MSNYFYFGNSYLPMYGVPQNFSYHSPMPQEPTPNFWGNFYPGPPGNAPNHTWNPHVGIQIGSNITQREVIAKEEEDESDDDNQSNNPDPDDDQNSNKGSEIDLDNLKIPNDVESLKDMLFKTMVSLQNARTALKFTEAEKESLKAENSGLRAEKKDIQDKYDKLIGHVLSKNG